MSNLEMGVFEELSQAEITIRTKGARKSQSLLDFLDDNELQVQFNNCDTVIEYRNQLLIHYHLFKDSLARLGLNNSHDLEETILNVKSKINEISMLLNPKDVDLVYAHVILPRNPRFINEAYHVDMVKKK